MKNLAIIPARSGSKGLKDKNIKELCGKPMIAYSIEAALNSEKFDMVYVSTDSEDYASIAMKYGAQVSFLRAESLSGDQIGTWDVVKDVVDCFEKMGQYYDSITLLQPTAPLRDAQDIINGFQLFVEKSASAVIGVCEMEHSPLWGNTLENNLCMNNFIRQDLVQIPRQQLPTYYRVNGALYLIRRERLEKMQELYDSKCFAYIMQRDHSIDIDDEIDFKIAEALLCR